MMDPVELILIGETVTVPVPVPAPVRKGSVTVGLSTARGGPTVHPTLERTLVVTDGVIPPITLFSRDVRAMWPRGGRCWIVVRYAGQLIDTGAVTMGIER